MNKIYPILLLFISFIINCQHIRNNENVSDYFYPLEKGKEFIYNDIFRNETTVKTVRIEDIRNEEGNIIVKLIETYKFPESLARTIKEGDKDIIERDIYEYTICENIIKKRKIVNEKGMQENVYLKGPIRIGTHWKVRGVRINGPNLVADKNNGKANNAEDNRDKYKLSRKQRITEINVVMTIADIIEKSIVGLGRKCIVISLDYPSNNSQKPAHILKLIFAKGLGYVGMVYGDEEWEKLVEVR